VTALMAEAIWQGYAAFVEHGGLRNLR